MRERNIKRAVKLERVGEMEKREKGAFLRVIRRNFHNEVKGKGKIASHNVTQDDASVFREKKRVRE